MALEKCPTCGRPMYVKRALGPEVLHLGAMLVLLAVLWLVVTHAAQLLRFAREVM